MYEIKQYQIFYYKLKNGMYDIWWYNNGIILHVNYNINIANKYFEDRTWIKI